MNLLLRLLRLQSLKARLRFLGITLVLMVGLLTISSYSFLEYRQTESNQINSMRKDSAIQQTAIDSWVAARASEIRNLANLQSTIELDIDDIKNNFTFFASHQQEFEAVSFANKEGIVEFSTMNQIGAYFSERTYLEEAAKGSEYISDVLLGKVTNQPMILFSAPVMNRKKQFEGVIYGTVTLKTIDKLMEQFRYGDSGESYLIDRNGYLITELRFEGNWKRLEFQLNSDILERAKQGIQATSTYESYRGKQVFGTYQSVNNGKWIAVNEIERDEVYRTFNRQLIVMIIIICIVLTFGFIVMLRISYHIEHPVQRLLKGVQRLKQGDYHYKIDYSSMKSAPVELLQLCEAFNQMAQNIHDNELELKRQKEDLAGSNAELEQFAYVASHDLQEPLRMVASYVQLLAKRYQGKLDQDADDFIHYAVDGAQRMQNLINDLLAFSRVGTKGKELKSVDFEVVLQHVSTNLQHAIQECDALVTHDPLPTLLADPTQMVQLLQNLVGNAIKFRDSNRAPIIHIGIKQQGNEWLFSVRDNGIGFEPKYRDRIFLIFQRLHNKTKYQGTGIGLSICKKIVERHGGKIWVDSEAGHSTTFYFTLPDRGEHIT
ncbi:signal transduction histidine kinase [Paenibacillus sp. V4I9]|uniref:sensor histidine kinase n=1 Tax=Paenibacillus sp. V4I9 TaxID=3042308 RepID=UPI002784606F|nr:ATP-binding protein [Paenibacillus sp. V4I9]MDQ0886825.1 signal transduction histidine kinase [Paenibacillus sp. V4I9]